MKKGILSKALALSLSMSMVLSTPVFATMTNSGGGTGGTQPEKYIIQLDAITANGLTTTLNALERNDAGSQITTKEWVIGSYSDVDVEMTMRVGLVDVNSSIDIFEDRKQVNGATTALDEDNVQKQAYVELVPAEKIKVDATKNDASVLNMKIYDKDAITSGDRPTWPDLGNATTNVVVPVADPETKPGEAAEMVFRLKTGTFKKAGDKDSEYTGDADGKSIAVVRLKGNLNSMAEYATDDFKIKVAYKAKGIPSGVYAAFTPITGTHAVKSIKAGAPSAVAPSITSAAGTVAGGGTIEYSLGTTAAKEDVDTTYFMLPDNASPNMVSWGVTGPKFDVNNNKIAIPTAATTHLGAGSHKFEIKIKGTVLTGTFVIS